MAMQRFEFRVAGEFRRCSTDGEAASSLLELWRIIFRRDWCVNVWELVGI